MYTHKHLLIAVLVAVALAGCASLTGGDATPEPTPTATATPTETPTQRPNESEELLTTPDASSLDTVPDTPTETPPPTPAITESDPEPQTEVATDTETPTPTPETVRIENPEMDVDESWHQNSDGSWDAEVTVENPHECEITIVMNVDVQVDDPNSDRSTRERLNEDTIQATIGPGQTEVFDKFTYEGNWEVTDVYGFVDVAYLDSTHTPDYVECEV